MKKFLFLLDQDGPLADFELAFWELCNELGCEMNIDGMEDPGRERFMSDNITNKHHRKMARSVIEDGGNHWFRNLPVTPGAKEGVDMLLTHPDVDLWVCTKPMEINTSCRDDKGLWLREHFPELEHRMILAPDKSCIKGDILLDDAPRLEWLPRASWRPVIFKDAFNGPGSQWDGLPRWTWGDPLEELLW